MLRARLGFGAALVAFLASVGGCYARVGQVDVVVSCAPLQAAVLFDGVAVGRCAQRDFSVPLQVSRLEVTAAGFLPARLDVTMGAGGEVRFEVPPLVRSEPDGEGSGLEVR
jgi:hypothetical protein